MENTVFLKLLFWRTKNPLVEIFYWQNKAKKEVDFVLKKGKKIEALIQSCAKVENFQTKKREVSALLKASKALRCNNLQVITFDYENEEVVEGKKVKFTPLWKWLLG